MLRGLDYRDRTHAAHPQAVFSPVYSIGSHRTDSHEHRLSSRFFPAKFFRQPRPFKVCCSECSDCDDIWSIIYNKLEFLFICGISILLWNWNRHLSTSHKCHDFINFTCFLQKFPLLKNTNTLGARIPSKLLAWLFITDTSILESNAVDFVSPWFCCPDSSLSDWKGNPIIVVGTVSRSQELPSIFLEHPNSRTV